MDCSEITVRRLAWACAGLSAGIAVRLLPEPLDRMVPYCVVGACALAVLLSGKLGRLRAGLFMLLFAVGVLYAMGWSIRTLDPVLELDGIEVTACARAVDVPREKNGCRTLEIVLDLPGRPKFTALVYDFDGVVPDLRAGDRLSGSFQLRRADRLRGERYEGYLSRGILMLAYPKGELTVSEHTDLFCLPGRLAQAVEKQAQVLFSGETGAFETALLTGRKEALYADAALNRAVAHAGIAHAVAVSGMHVSFVVGLALALCGTGRAAILGIPSVIVFVLMMGMTPSVVRAGILYLTVLTAPLLRRESDGITSLLLALALILLLNPAAAASVGLQLSFGAMAGILLLSEPIRRAMSVRRPKNRWLRRVRSGALNITAATLGASAGTIPLAAIHFGYIAPYSLLTNLLTYAVITLAFCLGYLACILSALCPPLGAAAAAVVTVCVRYVLWCAKAVAALPGSVLYTENPLFVQWMLFTALLFAAAWIFGKPGKFRAVFPASLAVLALCACCLMVNLAAPCLSPRITVLDVGQGQCVLLMAQGRTVVIDCGSGGTLESAGERAGEYLRARGVKRIDALVLTHLHADHANGARELLETVQADRLILAADLDDSDGLRDDILAAAAERGTQLCLIEEDMRLEAGQIALTILSPLGTGNANERGLVIRGSIGSFDVLVTGDIGSSTERELVHSFDLQGIELLIAGHHGSAGSSSLELMEAVRPESAVISVGYNSFGHPTAEAIERLTGFDARLYRTDLNGNVTFYIGEDHG